MSKERFLDVSNILNRDRFQLNLMFVPGHIDPNKLWLSDTIII